MNLYNISSAVQNHVSNGIKGVANFSYSLEQIEDEVITEWGYLLREQSKKGFIDYSGITNTLKCIPITCEDISRCCHPHARSASHVLQFTIPKLVNFAGQDSIKYAGTTDLQHELKIYTNMEFKNHKNRRRTANKPFVWIDTSYSNDGKHDGFIFNLSELESLTVIGVFEDPRKINDYACCKSDVIDIPEHLSRQIISNVSNRYIYYYKQLNVPVQPNTQTSLIS